MITDQRDNLRLQHIVKATEHIAEFIEGVTREEFELNYEKQSAVIRQLEIIGEAANRLSPEFIQRNCFIDWSKVVGMRHKMIHDYFEVDVNIIWTTAFEDVPLLKLSLNKIVY